MVSIEADGFKIHCLKSPTGLKFLLITDTSVSNVDKYLSEVYVLFSDYVCKNPFYVFNQPIKNTLFDNRVVKLFQ